MATKHSMSENTNPYGALTEQEISDKLEKSREHAAQGMYRDAAEVSRDMRANRSVRTADRERTG